MIAERLFALLSILVVLILIFQPAYAQEAIPVEEKNPDALQKLRITPNALQDIIMSKVPDLLTKQTAS